MAWRMFPGLCGGLENIVRPGLSQASEDWAVATDRHS
jgi:hypothetical protein